MGFRFRQGIRLFPALRLNLSKSGVSASVGKPGATINVGKRGVKSTVGVPGSGISYSNTLLKFGNLKSKARAALPLSAARNQESAPSFLENATDEQIALYASAIRLVIENQKASTSHIQRTLKISYNQASELIDAMEAAAIISGPDHVGRREVLVTVEQLRAAESEIEHDEGGDEEWRAT